MYNDPGVTSTGVLDFVFQLEPTKQQRGISQRRVLKYDDGFKIDYHEIPKG